MSRQISRAQYLQLVGLQALAEVNRKQLEKIQGVAGLILLGENAEDKSGWISDFVWAGDRSIEFVCEQLGVEIEKEAA